MLITRRSWVRSPLGPAWNLFVLFFPGFENKDYIAQSQTSYSAPLAQQNSYSAPQISFNAPQNSYNAPQISTQTNKKPPRGQQSKFKSLMFYIQVQTKAKCDKV